MRSREEIEKELKEAEIVDHGKVLGYRYQTINKLQIELLLDLRQLLNYEMTKTVPANRIVHPVSAPPPVLDSKGRTTT